MQIHGYFRLSVGVALATIALKTAAWWWTGSVGLLSDALESFVNLAAAIFGLWMVTVAARPADDDHPFGHAKAEYFSSGFEGLLILGAAMAIAVAALLRWWQPQPLEAVGIGMVLSVASSALNGLLAWVMWRAARQHHSIALEAGARHLLTDVWTSAGVVLALLLIVLTGWQWLDPAVALLVAANISREGIALVRRSADGLMDHALTDAEQRVIEDTLRAAVAAVDGVRADDLRTRRAAQLRFCELHLHVPADWTIGRSMRLREDIARALVRAVPRLQVTIELLPFGEEPLGRAASTSPS
ncbi:cation diffusion facilitator family transporter [Rivibacter subsaxonicus]|uniref:Cation diffusion facilitator family transporter n=1 Tax=Rivibacter subsaxonicus TaxID=457575 RepID=A0A4Q7VZ30_9BURK|nr:cation diffusion facilitator family transporter [Rivibacter subsaxonicus]RZU02027.1 cation diffusion facilitator family transporter [Rivibacter subsaxonicus]